MGLTRKQAKELYDSNIWHGWSDIEIVKFQLFEDRVCVKWSRFHEALEAVLGRPVFTHEFIYGDLKNEYLTLAQPPTMEEIIAMIPEEKLILLNLDSNKPGDVTDRLLGFLDDE